MSLLPWSGEGTGPNPSGLVASSTAGKILLKTDILQIGEVAIMIYFFIGRKVWRIKAGKIYLGLQLSVQCSSI